jgi:hypothetical protein
VRSFSDHFVVVFLLFQADLMVVLTCVGVVEVGEFGNVTHPLVGHLENGDADCHVVGSLQIGTVIVFEVFFFDVEEELSIEGPQVTGHERVGAILVVLYGGDGEGARIAYRVSDAQEVCVDEPGLLLLEDSVEEFEHLPAQQLVVPVSDQEDVLGLAVFLRSHPQVGHRSLLLRVPDDGVAGGGHPSLIVLEEGLDLFACAIGAGVVDEDDVVVGVVLHED